MNFTQGQFWLSGIVIACVCGSVITCVYQSRACPHNNSSPVQARINKFGPDVQNTLIKVPIVFGDDRPWPSRLNVTSNSNFTSFWACPHHNSSVIQVRITKKCILVLLRPLLIWGLIDFDFHFHFQSWNLFLCQIYLHSSCIILSEIHHL